MDQHRENLDKLCRLCGGRCISSDATLRGKCAKLCSANADKIMATFHVNVEEDDMHVHPRHMCHSCYCQLFVSVDKTPPTWQPHPRLGACPVCISVVQQSRPGRRKTKAKSGGRPRAPPPFREHFSSLPPSPTVSREKILKFEPLSSTAPVECKICTMLLDNALETPCMHLFCCECLAVQFEASNSATMPCPDCQAPVHFKDVTSPRGYFASLFLNLVMKCTACKVSVTVGEISSHTCRNLESADIISPSFSVFHDHSYATSSEPPSEVTRLLQRPLTAPVTPLMEELGTHILRTKLMQSSDGSTTQYRTGGPPLTTLCVPQPRKSSGDACSSTIRNRSRILDKTRGLVSMDAKDIQQKDELKLSALRDDLRATLQDLKLNTIRIPAMKLLAVKSHLGISWTRIRELKKWLKSYNILTEGEQALRQQQQDVVADNLFAESVPFSFPDDINGGVTIKQAPCVGVKSLVAKVTQQLDEYQKRDQLTWHKGNIPHNEVWVKVGGDKGGGTFKQMIQVGNVERPNSLRHTVVVCAFAAGDTSDNLKTGLQRFRQQVAALQSSTWKSHNIRLFVFGDYEYLCRIYGITGASGRHCCLYCTITKDDMRLPRGQRPPSQQRTLESLNQDLQGFKKAGSKLSKAKLFNNVIDEPMFPIQLTQVCPPGLHISLGLYLKHFNSFEGACHDLDMQAAAVLAQNQEDQVTAALGSGYQKLVSVLKKARQLQQQAEALDEEFKLKEDQLTDTILSSEEGSADMEDYIAATKALTDQRERLLAEAGTLRSKAKLTPGQGPLAGQLDITLQEFRVQRQAYHGKSFVGNHVHKCCKEENIMRLTNAIVVRTQQVCPSLVPEARTIAAKYAELFHLFGICHRKYNTASILDDHAVDALGQDIKNYLAYFRATFPSESVPPKMHLLEDHVIPWIRQWHFGLGFHGEQGGESVHAHLNSLRRDVRGLRDDVSILQSVIRTHWILTSPAHAPATLFE